jgi:hypothetical protein
LQHHLQGFLLALSLDIGCNAILVGSLIGKWNINFNGDFYNKVSQSTQTAINDGKLDAESESKVRSNLYAAKL